MIAPVGGAIVDIPIIIEDTFAVPMSSADAGDPFPAVITGVIQNLVKATGFAPTAGEKAYWNESGLTLTSDTDDTFIGVYAEAVLSAVLVADVRLNGIALSGIGGVLDADEVAYVNTTSGLTADELQAATDEVVVRIKANEDDKMDLVAVPANGKLMKMDATGQGYDSGISYSEVQVLIAPAAADNLSSLSVTGVLEDAGISKDVVQVYTVPAAADNMAGFDVNGKLIDTGIAKTDITSLTAAHVPYVNTISGLTATDVQAAIDEVVVDLADANVYIGIDEMADGAAMPATPVDGYKVLCDGDGGVYLEGYIYTYSTTLVDYDAGVILADGQIASVVGSAPDLIVGGTALTDYTQLSERMLLVDTPVTDNFIMNDVDGQGVDSGVAYTDVADNASAISDLNGYFQFDEAEDFGDITATPADGYVAFCTETGGSFVEGYYYTYVAGATNAYGAGVLLADGEVASVKGASPYLITGGTGATDYTDTEDLAAMIDVKDCQVANSTDTSQDTITATKTDIAFEDSVVEGDITVGASFKLFTIVETGLYTVAWNLVWTGNATNDRSAHLLLGSDIIHTVTVAPGGASAITIYGSLTVSLTAADILKVQAEQDSGGNLAVTAGSMAIQRIM